MFILVPNSMAMVHSQSSNTPSRRPWISRSYSSSAKDESSQPPSSVQGSCHSPLPISSRTRSRDLLPDTDQIVFSVRLNTEEDPEYDPKAAGEELEGRRIAPIGSQRPQSQAQPPSPAVPLPVAESSQTAYFPPPGLVRGEPPSRPASTPPESWNRSSTPPTQPDSDKSRLLALLEDEFESKFVDMKQFRGDGSKDKSQRQPEDKNKGTDNAQDQGGECSPAERKKSGRATPRQRPFFGCVSSLPVPTTTTPAHTDVVGSDRSYTCHIQCCDRACERCAYLRFRGNLLATKIGQRTTNARLLRVTPFSEWPYVEDMRKVLRLQDSYRRGSARALAELSLRY